MAKIALRITRLKRELNLVWMTLDVIINNFSSCFMITAAELKIVKHN